MACLILAVPYINSSFLKALCIKLVLATIKWKLYIEGSNIATSKQLTAWRLSCPPMSVHRIFYRFK